MAVLPDPQHAAEPWTLEPIPNYQGHASLVGAAIVTPAVMVAEVRGAIKVDGRTHEQNAANAALLAAAPRLLKCARELHRLSLVIESAVRNADPRHHPAVLKAIKENTAAIRAAQGLTQ